MATTLKSVIHVGAAFVAYGLANVLVLAPPAAWWAAPGGRTVLALAILYALLSGMIARLCRVERKTWRYVSINDAFDLVRCTLLTAAVFLAIAFVTSRADDVPRSVLLLTWGMHLVSLCALRVLRRLVHERSLVRAIAPMLRRTPAEGRAILLVGPVALAESFLRELAREARPQYRALGILALDSADVGQVVRGISVIGVLSDLEPAIEARRDGSNEVEAILFLSPPDVVQDVASDILVRLKASGLSLLRLPAMHEISAAHTSLPTALRELSVEELLARPAVRLDLSRIHDLVNGKRVLVTGAGGSIGSELCRQVAAYGCARLALLDHSEYALFKIDQEIGVAHPGLSRGELICDVRDRARVLACVGAEAPDIIFHAAALKHVPMVENHPTEGLLTNVVGTWNVAEAARAHAGHMVLISTDKAVDPHNVMGATKRLAEAVVRAQHGRSRTRFSVVRFGNVLGSAGSVVATFQSQIARGGPVTVTHPDVERYFMTIPEAVQLVLHVTAESAGRDLSQASVFVLEMGEPVKILELARTMIALHGRSTGEAIGISFTGLRRGEKLTETLIDNNERILTQTGSVIEVVTQPSAPGITASQIRQLEGVARSGDEGATRRLAFAQVARLRGRNDDRIAV